MSDDVVGAQAPGEAAPQTTVPTPGETAQPGETGEVKQEQPPKTFTQAELDREISKRLGRQERKLRNELLGLVREKINPPTPPAEEPKQVEPKLDQFKDWDEYNRALIRHEAEKIVAEREKKTQANQAVNEHAKRQAEIASAHTSRVDQAKGRYEDYDDVVDPILELNVPSYIVELVGGSDKSADLLYKLGENPKEFLRIAKLAPVAAARELAKLELSIAAPAKPASSAPAPVPTIVGKSSESTADPSDKDGTDVWMRKEWARMKKAGKLPV